MARSYYSTVFEESVDQVRAVIRDFNNYSIFVDGLGESHIENDKSGESVGAIRNVRLGEKVIRQRLLALSDRDRYYSYEFCNPIPFPVRNYVATLRLTPVIDGSKTFVEWSATFDCAAEEYDCWKDFYSNSFAKWLKSLRALFAKT